MLTKHVESYVKKVAFVRLANPFGFGLAICAVNKLKRMVLRLPAARVWLSAATLYAFVQGSSAGIGAAGKASAK